MVVIKKLLVTHTWRVSNFSKGHIYSMPLTEKKIFNGNFNVFFCVKWKLRT